MGRKTQRPPQWGVMHNDGSVTCRWNGRTQLTRALVYCFELRRLDPRSNITLAYRENGRGPWVRIGHRGAA